MTSGRNPAASMARAVPKPKDPWPCPISKITPRSRAATISSRTPPSGAAGELGNGRKQWVSTSPLRSRDKTSSRLGGGKSRWHITGRLTASATSSAMSSGATPEVPPALLPTRTLMPTTRSRCSSATFLHSRRSSRRISAHSPTITLALNAKMPAKETLRYGKIRTGADFAVSQRLFRWHLRVQRKRDGGRVRRYPPARPSRVPKDRGGTPGPRCRHQGARRKQGGRHLGCGTARHGARGRGGREPPGDVPSRFPAAEPARGFVSAPQG